jgi:putative nucleotidyltransferase with HDIG domain
MHSDSEIVMPLLQLKEFDEYTASHSINVSVLSMALAEFLGLGQRDVRAIGVAGLLHDVGMIRVPKEIVSKNGPPSPQEWKLIKQHPIEGAKLILKSEPNMDLAAVVAYEHHILPDGSGYPALHYPRETHYGTKMIQVCAIYDALRTRRYHRDAMPPENAMKHIEERAGVEFDLETGRAFLKMIRQWERRMFVTDETTAVRMTPSHGVPVVMA